MADIRSRKGAAASMTPVLMVLAFVAMAGFLYWLSITAEGTEVQVRENGNDTAEVDTGPAAENVSRTQFRSDPTAYVGQRIRVRDVEVASLLGQSGTLFWLAPNDNPYLVHVDSALQARGATVRPGLTGAVIGTVHEMSDSVLDAWDAQGAFGAPADRIVAEFATTFIQADRLELRAPQQGGGGEGGGEGGGSGR